MAIAWQQLCETLLAIRKSREWAPEFISFEAYVVGRWALSKTRAKLFCDFAKFCAMARAEYLPLPISPDTVTPVLRLQQSRWMEVWAICSSYDAKTKNEIQSLLAHLGIGNSKRIPQYILNGRRVRKAAETLAEFNDGEKLVDEIGPDALGKNWDEAVRVTIDADQAKMDETRK